MKTSILERQSDSARQVQRPATSSRPKVLAQRRSTFGPGGSIAAPAIVDSGRPLDSTTRSAMEGGFGREFSGIRVHDDARAHDDARSLGARAYAAGDHIVFGEGAYQPQTPSGRALIAHELAHSVQQAGVQMKPDGSIPAARDAELESQADRAALDVTAGRSVSALSSIGRPAIFKAEGDPPPSPTTTAAGAAGSSPDLPSDVAVIDEKPAGAGSTLLVVSLPLLTLPRVKGKGAWVQQAYSAVAAGGRMVFNPMFSGTVMNSTISAYMEKPSENYKNIWLNNFGFTSLKGVADAFAAAAAANPEVKAVADNPAVQPILTGFTKNNLTTAKCDIDHIVEKQIGGASVSSNLQVLLSDKNQASGRDTYQFLIAEAKRILANRTSVTTFQLRYRDARVLDDVEDGSFMIETILRQGKVKGSEEVMKKGEGSPVLLLAGGASEAVRVRATGSTPIDTGERRLISGMKFLQYNRAAGSTPTAGTDTIDAELQSKPVISAGKKIILAADVAPAPAVADPSAGAAAAEKAAATEIRKLKLDPIKNGDLKFLYPYLSEGKFTKLAIDDQARLTGEGVITPSVKFLGDLKVTFGPDQLVLIQDINTESINSSAFMRPLASVFRFTSGSVSLDLVKFKPQGNLELEVGPKGKPIVLGSIMATEEGGNFLAKGTLRPGGSIPGIKEAKGEVTYRSDTGWAGVLEASSTSIPNSTASVKLGFKEDKGAFRPYAEGGITTTIRNATLNLKVGWGGGSVSYTGGARIEKPFPMVESVDLKGGYSEGLLRVTGEAPIKWKSVSSTLNVVYSRKDGEEGKFSGKATFGITTEKAEGSLTLYYDEDGSFSGSGSISYQVTKDVRPKLGIEVAKDRKIRMFGEVAINDIPLTKMWPAPAGGTLTFIKGVGVKFNIPTPVPSVTAYGQIKASAGLGYGIGPVMLKGLTFKGELYPLEDDPKVKATLKGKLAVPAYAEIYGTFGAYIGLEVLLGAVGAKGGIEVTPALRVQGEGGIDFDAAYEAFAFTFSAEAYAKGQMIAKLKVDLLAEIYAAWGVFSHTWTYNVAALEKPIGPELKLTLGKVAYGKNGEITWPSLSQISLEPKEIDPMDLVKDLMGKGKATPK